MERFTRFLQEEASKHQALYILGDLFEVWLGDDISCNDYAPILEAFQKASQQGTSIYVQRGNRDFLLREDFEQQSGCRLIPDPYILETDSGRILLSHGDLFCSDDLSYQRYRSFIQHPITQWLLLHLPGPIRRWIGHKLRQQSDYGKQRKPSAVMDLNQQQVEVHLQREKSLCMVHGHTHRPGIHSFTLNGKSAQRLVLGDWDSDSNILIHNTGGFIQLTV